MTLAADSMQSMSLFVWLAGVLVVLAVVAVAVVFFARGRSSSSSPGVTAAAAPTTEREDNHAAGTPVAQPEAIGLPVGDVNLVYDSTSDASAAGLLEFEVPEPAGGRMQRLRSRLARSQSTLGRGLLTLLSRDTIDESTWDEIEEVLLAADVGVAPTQELITALRTKVRVDGTSDPGQVRAVLRAELLALVDPTMDRHVRTERIDGRPGVALVVGVNGTGKTTTTGKLARLAVSRGETVVLAAADTFRAAAADQLQTWGDRVGAVVVRGPEGGDPASVAFEAVDIAQQADCDTVIIDTAGRLHTKTGLMDELGKVKRVVEKKSPIDEVLLVLDATTGQNGLVQARVFADVVAVTGIVLTKLDGTARGGIVIAVQRELGVPVKLVGLGEGPDDLAPFEPETFVDALLAD
ncbi:MAG: signal recognition particle-docking protein FtsY [Candidatus Nanopelagicales bacterium]|jgi:fused signal recognition particle receptor|nr:signal recognition particle-docking protein FtsY [Candidatus Nanopelagicales bacterium]